MPGSTISMRQTGLGAYSPVIWDDTQGGWVENPDNVYTNPAGSPAPVGWPGDGQSTQKQPGVFQASLPTLISLGLKDIHDIWAPPEVSIAQARGAQSQFGGSLTAAQQQAQYLASLQQQRGNSNSFGVNSGGVNLFGSQVGWVPILIVVGILFFPGFSRRK